MGSNGVAIHWPSMTRAQILAHPGVKIVELFRRWHKGRGWRDIGYHLVINRNYDGTVQTFEGRDIWTAGAHSGTTYGNAFIGLNIAYGTDEELPENMFDHLARQIADLSDKYNFEISSKTVRGHYTFVATDCPGQSLIRRLPELRKRANQYAQIKSKPDHIPEPVDENIGKIKISLNGEIVDGLRLNSQSYLHSTQLRKLGLNVDYDKEQDLVIITNGKKNK